MMGDYNVVCNVVDKINDSDVSEAETTNLSSFILDNQLMEAPSTGVFYSWNNKGVGGDRISCIIDQDFVNCSWIKKYSDVIVTYLIHGISDHVPILFSLEEIQAQGGRPFIFRNFSAD